MTRNKDNSRFPVSAALVLSLAIGGYASEAQAQQAPSDSDDYGVNEIVVTAAKREERLSKVGGGVAAFSGEKLEERSADSLEDYLAFIPGVQLQSFGTTGYGIVAIRGISPQSVGASTATYVDDIPYGPTSALTRGSQFTLDLDPSDLERVEVLKGPQGSLYGASSMGGVLKYVTRSPNLQDAELRLSQEAFKYDGGGLGLKLRGSVSTPIIQDKVAVRVSGFYKTSEGYIDDIGIGGKNANSNDNWGARATLLIKPTDAISLRLNAVKQKISSDGSNAVAYKLSTFEPAFGDRINRRYAREPFYSKTDLYSAELNWDVGPGSVVFANSYSRLQTSVVGDVTETYELYYNPSGRTHASPTSPYSSGYAGDVKKETSELRFASNRLGPLEFIVGGFYTHEKLEELSSAQSLTQFGALDTSDPRNPYQSTLRRGTLTEYAGFANATVYLADSFDITGGFRYSELEQTRFRQATGYLNNPANPTAVVTTEQKFKENADTYLLGARWRLNDNILLYTRAASGYRPGGGRTVPPGAPADFPIFYTSDSIWSYEAGTKIRTDGGKLSVDLGGFWIDWTNIQALEPVGIYVVDGNAGKARSRGVELQVDYRLAKGLTVGANAAYTDSTFTEANALLGIAKGDRLFYVPKWATAAYADYRAPINANWTASFGADYQYVSNKLDLSRNILPGYSLVNVRGGLETDHFRVGLYVQNLFDKRGLTGGGGGVLTENYGITVVQPRTFGINFSQNF
ncbi:TonB-dependent receptor [Sphingopyxis panaciterrae]